MPQRPPDAPVSPDGLWWWDGAAWQPAPPPGPPVAPYRVGSGLAFLACAGLGAVTVMNLANAAVDVVDIQQYQGVLRRAQALAEADAVVGFRALVVLVLFYLSFLPTILFVCLWMKRAAANLPALGAVQLRFSPRWAVAWWFVPAANLLRPLQVMTEIWKASDPAVASSDRASRRAMPTPALLLGWWLAWLAGNGLANLANRQIASASTAAANIDSFVLDLVAELVLVAAGILAILVVKRADARQVAKAARTPPSPTEVAAPGA